MLNFYANEVYFILFQVLLYIIILQDVIDQPEKCSLRSVYLGFNFMFQVTCSSSKHRIIG